MKFFEEEYERSPHNACRLREALSPFPHPKDGGKWLMILKCRQNKHVHFHETCLLFCLGTCPKPYQHSLQIQENNEAILSLFFNKETAKVG